MPLKDMELRDKKTVCILYNQVDEKDLPDRKDVIEEVKIVSESLSKLKISYFLLPVDKNNEWLYILKDKKFDVVFNLCEDIEGHPEGEALIAGFLEILKIPYTGSPPDSLFLCLDKIKAKEVVKGFGIKTPPYFFIEREKPPFLPCIIKPIKSDSSSYIEKKNVIFSEKEYRKRVREIKENYRIDFFAEKYIEGREFNVSIFDNKVIAIGEVIFKTEPKILTYDSKWDKESEEYIKTPVKYPALIDEEKEKEIKEISLKAFKVIGMRDYGRIDLRMDDKGEVYFIEANPNPCISRDSGFYRALQYAGIPYENFVEKILWNAIKRKK